MQPAADIPSTYISRGLSTVNDSWIGDVYRGDVGFALKRDGSEMLNPDAANNEFGNGGRTKFTEPVSRSYAQFKSNQDAITFGLQDTLARGGSASASNTWLGSGVAQAAGLLDPFQDGAAILSDGITKFAPIRPGFIVGPATSRLAARMVAGAQTAATFSAITEPLHYAMDDNWSLSEAAQRLGSGALFLGLTHGLFGADNLKPYREEPVAGEPQVPTAFQQLEDHLQPETKAAMAQASVARAQSDLSFDPINDLVGLDKRIVAHEAALSAIAGHPVTLPLEQRAAVLQSMDDGTYVSPLEEPKVDLPPATPAPSESFDSPAVIPQSKGSISLEVNFPPSAEVSNSLKEASTDPFVAAVAKASGITRVSIDSPASFELSQQGGVAPDGSIRINPDATDAKGTFLHELGHVVWDKSSDAQKNDILQILKAHHSEIAAASPGYSDINDPHQREEAIAELFRLGTLTDSEKAKLTEPRLGTFKYSPKKVVQAQKPKTTDSTVVRSWKDVEEKGHSYLTAKDDLSAMAAKYGDRSIVMKDVNGGRGIFKASKLGELLKNPQFSGYVRELFLARNPKEPESLGTLTIEHLSGLKNVLENSKATESLIQKRVQDLQRKVALEATPKPRPQTPAPVKTTADQTVREQLKPYEQAEKAQIEKKLTGEPKEAEAKMTTVEKIDKLEEQKQPGYNQAIRCVTETN